LLQISGGKCTSIWMERAESQAYAMTVMHRLMASTTENSSGSSR